MVEPTKQVWVFFEWQDFASLLFVNSTNKKKYETIIQIPRHAVLVYFYTSYALPPDFLWIATIHFLQKKSTRTLSIAISSDWRNIFQLFFHILVELRLKFPVCEIHVHSINRTEVDFFLFLFPSSFSLFLRIFYRNHIPLSIIFPTSTKSLLNSNSIKSYRGLKKHCQRIWNRL